MEALEIAELIVAAYDYGSSRGMNSLLDVQALIADEPQDATAFEPEVGRGQTCDCYGFGAPDTGDPDYEYYSADFIPLDWRVAYDDPYVNVPRKIDELEERIKLIEQHYLGVDFHPEQTVEKETSHGCYDPGDACSCHNCHSL